MAELGPRREDAERRLLRLTQRDPLVAATVRRVAASCGVSAADLLRRNRCRAGIAAARQLAMYLVNVKLEYTMTQVGGLFGRDRTTVAHACMAVEDRRDEPAFDEAVSLLEAEIDGLMQQEPVAEVRHAAG